MWCFFHFCSQKQLSHLKYNIAISVFYAVSRKCKLDFLKVTICYLWLGTRNGKNKKMLEVFMSFFVSLIIQINCLNNSFHIRGTTFLYQFLKLFPENARSISKN